MNACAVGWPAAAPHRPHDVQVARLRAPVITAAWPGGRAHRPGLWPLRRPAVRAAPGLGDRPVPAGLARISTRRGASDDKGQFIAHLAAIEAWLATSAGCREPPAGLRRRRGDRQPYPGSGGGAPDGPAGRRRRPGIRHLDARPRCPGPDYRAPRCAGNRLEVSGPRRDLHAGAFGGAVTNPAEVLAALVASLHDKAGAGIGRRFL